MIWEPPSEGNTTCNMGISIF